MNNNELRHNLEEFFGSLQNKINELESAQFTSDQIDEYATKLEDLYSEFFITEASPDQEYEWLRSRTRLTMSAIQENLADISSLLDQDLQRAQLVEEISYKIHLIQNELQTATEGLHPANSNNKERNYGN